MTFDSYSLDFDAAADPHLQRQLEEIDSKLRGRFGLTTDQAAVGLVDLRTLRHAMIHPDRQEYAASLPKIGILLAWFSAHPEAATRVAPEIARDLGLMVKSSSNEMATKFSRELGLSRIQEVLLQNGFYDPARGGGLWMGKHYGDNSERIGDPLADHSHAATVRQVLRFLLLMEQEKLLPREASKRMREICESPEIPHDPIKFVAGLAAHDLQIIRKWGSWENWLHDAAVVRGEGLHYILAALTRHPSGDEYLAAVAGEVHRLLLAEAA